MILKYKNIAILLNIKMDTIYLLYNFKNNNDKIDKIIIFYFNKLFGIIK